MDTIQKILRKIFNNLGFDIIKFNNRYSLKDIHLEVSNKKQSIINLEALAHMSLSVPGMISTESGKFLYSLCYMQELKGDVVEIGSWQGRSTIFLGNAVKDSDNGNLFAVDHFQGNIGKEVYYKVNNRLDNLKLNFKNNIRTFNLSDTINLLDTTNVDASNIIADKTIRFLFIDGDHTEEGVLKDIELFFPRLVKDSIVVFDDYFTRFPGLMNAVNDLIVKQKFSRVFYYKNTLVLKI